MPRKKRVFGPGSSGGTHSDKKGTACFRCSCCACVARLTCPGSSRQSMLLPRAHWIHKLVLCRPEPQLTYATVARANRLPHHQEPRERPREAVFAVTWQAVIVADFGNVPSWRYLRRDGRPTLSADEAWVLVRAHKLGLSQEAEMMKRFSEIVVAAVSGLDTRRCTASIRSAGHQSHASTRHAPFLRAVSACV